MGDFKQFMNDDSAEPTSLDGYRKNTQRDNTTEIDDSGYTAKDYLNMVDEDGQRFKIPGLSITDPDYISRYIDYMKVKIHQPELWNKIISWE